ncbi:MAG TPA: murein biosynthesis integral membrane protein MurJ [Gemmatimonadaceae bacterium]|nr:murein biosynthesis integral membrane protein MurJ [Gemmatimonadaceae bacterium]
MRKPARDGSGGHALLVAAGIFLSRIFGLVRTKVLAYYFGLGDVKDAYAAALRIPNVLQNLFGEGALSASFIPVYAKLLAEGDTEEARRVAGAVFSLLALVTAVLVLLGVLLAGPIVTILAPGFEGEKLRLTIQLVRIFFPGVGLLVLSAWCLGVLNSHRRFLLSYASPVLWNLAIIAALVAGGGRTSLPELARWAAWGAVAGSALQFGVQLPVALRLARGLRLSLGRRSPPVRTVLRNFGPALIGRGAAQIGGTVDLMIASKLPARAVGALADAQMIYTLPVSLFGMSISAAELPAMSSVTGSAEEIAVALRARIAAAARRVSFFVVPSAAALLTLGDQIAAVVLQGGEFGAADARYVWAVLAGSSVGLLAATLARLLSSSFYALRDTRTPLRFALARIALGIALGLPAALWLPGALGIDRQWGAALLTLASGIAGWTEFALLRRAISRRIGGTDVGVGVLVRLWGAALLAATVAWGAKLAIATPWPQLTAVVVLGVFGTAYLALTTALGIGETAALLKRLRRRATR